jgi:hypothetical protein
MERKNFITHFNQLTTNLDLGANKIEGSNRAMHRVWMDVKALFQRIMMRQCQKRLSKGTKRQ